MVKQQQSSNATFAETYVQSVIEFCIYIGEHECI